MYGDLVLTPSRSATSLTAYAGLIKDKSALVRGSMRTYVFDGIAVFLGLVSSSFKGLKPLAVLPYCCRTIIAKA